MAYKVGTTIVIDDSGNVDWSRIANKPAAGVAAVLVYLGIGWLLGLSETHDLVKLLKSTAVKIGRPINIIWNS